MMRPISLPASRQCGSVEQLPGKEEVGQEGELHVCCWVASSYYIMLLQSTAQLLFYCQKCPFSLVSV